MLTLSFSAKDRGFPGVVGVIDGTHISIRAPVEEPDAYINRKKFHSVQLQVNMKPECVTKLLLSSACIYTCRHMQIYSG